MNGAPTAAGLGAALLLTGLGFGTPSLTLAGIGLLVLAVTSIVWVELARPRRLVRVGGPSRVIEDEPFEVRIRAIGARARPPAGELSDDALEDPVVVGPRWRGTHAAEVKISGRGRRRLRPARLEVHDPLRLRVRSVESEPPGELLVLPRIHPVIVGGAGSDSGGLGNRSRGGDAAAAGYADVLRIELEVDGLRAYRQGSPASRIHWPAVARTGELVERRLIAGADSAPLVVLDSSRPASEERLDAAVRAAASLCIHLAQRGGCAALLPGDRRPTTIEAELRGWPHLHARFALAEAAPAPSLSTAGRSGAIFWVTARARPALPVALRGAGPAGRYLVAPGGTGRGRPVFAVAGCEGFALGQRAGRPAERAA